LEHGLSTFVEELPNKKPRTPICHNGFNPGPQTSVLSENVIENFWVIGVWLKI
jgi:hypothetical protein